MDDYQTHEVLHTTHVLMDAWSRHVVDAIHNNLEWKQQAQKIEKAMFDLYQNIGHQHLNE